MTSTKKMQSPSRPQPFEYRGSLTQVNVDVDPATSGDQEDAVRPQDDSSHNINHNTADEAAGCKIFKLSKNNSNLPLVPFFPFPPALESQILATTTDSFSAASGFRKKGGASSSSGAGGSGTRASGPSNKKGTPHDPRFTDLIKEVEETVTHVAPYHDSRGGSGAGMSSGINALTRVNVNANADRAISNMWQLLYRFTQLPLTEEQLKALVGYQKVMEAEQEEKDELSLSSKIGFVRAAGVLLARLCLSPDDCVQLIVPHCFFDMTSFEPYMKKRKIRKLVSSTTNNYTPQNKPDDHQHLLQTPAAGAGNAALAARSSPSKGSPFSSEKEASLDKDEDARASNQSSESDESSDSDSDSDSDSSTTGQITLGEFVEELLLEEKFADSLPRWTIPTKRRLGPLFLSLKHIRRRCLMNAELLDKVFICAGEVGEDKDEKKEKQKFLQDGEEGASRSRRSSQERRESAAKNLQPLVSVDVCLGFSIATSRIPDNHGGEDLPEEAAPEIKISVVNTPAPTPKPQASSVNPLKKKFDLRAAKANKKNNKARPVDPPAEQATKLAIGKPSATANPANATPASSAFPDVLDPDRWVRGAFLTVDEETGFARVAFDTQDPYVKSLVDKWTAADNGRCVQLVRGPVTSSQDELDHCAFSFASERRRRAEGLQNGPINIYEDVVPAKRKGSSSIGEEVDDTSAFVVFEVFFGLVVLPPSPSSPTGIGHSRSTSTFGGSNRRPSSSCSNKLIVAELDFVSDDEEEENGGKYIYDWSRSRGYSIADLQRKYLYISRQAASKEKEDTKKSAFSNKGNKGRGGGGGHRGGYHAASGSGPTSGRRADQHLLKVESAAERFAREEQQRRREEIRNKYLPVRKKHKGDNQSYNSSTGYLNSKPNFGDDVDRF
ncbi:unnamed protein product [Amoebophrya sp. A25]|nr:unnamed protein product [Amoebophrya sp. A25]|eukprot:GSA25T00014687001.1